VILRRYDMTNAPLPRDGRVELDFNKAENPPCAFTPFATRSLPPKQNILPVRIDAGERVLKRFRDGSEFT